MTPLSIRQAGTFDRGLTAPEWDWFWSAQNIATYLPWQRSRHPHEMMWGGVTGEALVTVIDRGFEAWALNASWALDNRRLQTLSFPWTMMAVIEIDPATPDGAILFQSSDWQDATGNWSGVAIIRTATGVRAGYGADNALLDVGLQTAEWVFDLTGGRHVLSITCMGPGDWIAFGDGRVLDTPTIEGNATSLVSDPACTGRVGNASVAGKLYGLSVHNGAWSPVQHRTLHTAMRNDPQGGPFAMQMPGVIGRPFINVAIAVASRLGLLTAGNLTMQQGAALAAVIAATARGGIDMPVVTAVGLTLSATANGGLLHDMAIALEGETGMTSIARLLAEGGVTFEALPKVAAESQQVFEVDLDADLLASLMSGTEVDVDALADLALELDAALAAAIRRDAPEMRRITVAGRNLVFRRR